MTDETKAKEYVFYCPEIDFIQVTNDRKFKAVTGNNGMWNYKYKAFYIGEL